jgi:hypothetical protein
LRRKATRAASVVAGWKLPPNDGCWYRESMLAR